MGKEIIGSCDRGLMRKKNHDNGFSSLSDQLHPVKKNHPIMDFFFLLVTQPASSTGNPPPPQKKTDNKTYLEKSRYLKEEWGTGGNCTRPQNEKTFSGWGKGFYLTS